MKLVYFIPFNTVTGAFYSSNGIHAITALMGPEEKNKLCTKEKDFIIIYYKIKKLLESFSF